MSLDHAKVRAACWTLVVETSAAIAGELGSGKLPARQWVEAFAKAFTETFLERLGPDAADPAALPLAVEELAGAYMSAIVTLIEHQATHAKRAADAAELARLVRDIHLRKAREN